MSASTSVISQNYRMVVGMSVAHDAMHQLMAADIAIYEVRIEDGQGYIVADGVNERVAVAALSSIRRGGHTLFRGVLCGCVVEWHQQQNRQSKREVAA